METTLLLLMTTNYKMIFHNREGENNETIKDIFQLKNQDKMLSDDIHSTISRFFISRD